MSFRPFSQISPLDPAQALRRAAFLTEEASKMSALPEPAGPARKDWRAELTHRPRRERLPPPRQLPAWVARRPLRGASPAIPPLSKVPAWVAGARELVGRLERRGARAGARRWRAALALARRGELVGRVAKLHKQLEAAFWAVDGVVEGWACGSS